MEFSSQAAPPGRIRTEISARFNSLIDKSGVILKPPAEIISRPSIVKYFKTIFFAFS